MRIREDGRIDIKKKKRRFGIKWELDWSRELNTELHILRASYLSDEFLWRSPKRKKSCEDLTK